MATASIALQQWNAEYYETMAAAAKAQLAVYSGAWYVRLLMDFRKVAHEYETLVHGLAQLEASPSSILLQEEARDIPQSLRLLFRKGCVVLESADRKGLTRNWLMAQQITRINDLNQRVSGFADRYEAAQQKLATVVPAGDIGTFRDSFDAYRNCGPVSDAATEDDVKAGILHF